MNSRIEEGSEALKNRMLFPNRISEYELTLLKLAIATHEEFPISSDNTFKRTSDEWIALEEALGECLIAVFHHYKPTSWKEAGIAILLLAPNVEGQYQVWVAEGAEALRKTDQAMEVRDY